MIEKAPLQKLMQEYKNLLSSFDVSNEDVGVEKYKKILGEINVFWLRHKRYLMYLLSNIENTDKAYYLAGGNSSRYC